MKLDRRIIAGAAFAMAMSLTQCKDTITAPEVALENLSASVTTATVKAVEGVTFTFAGGGSVLGSAYNGQTFSVKFTNTSATSPTATFTLPSGTYTATTTFGSCIFTFSTPNWSGPNPLTIPSCGLTFNTAGVPTGGTLDVGVSLILGAAASGPVSVPVSVDSNGNVSVGGTQIGTVRKGSATGSTN